MNCTRGLQNFMRLKQIYLSVGCLGNTRIISVDWCKPQNWMELYILYYTQFSPSSKQNAVFDSCVLKIIQLIFICTVSLLAWCLWVWPQYTSGKPAKTSNKDLYGGGTCKGPCVRVLVIPLPCLCFCLFMLFLIASCWGGVGWVEWVRAIKSFHFHICCAVC